ncbi:MAG: hypothetical protein ACP5K1_02955 [Candidatus Bathyarchaeia archaeon]
MNGLWRKALYGIIAAMILSSLIFLFLAAFKPCWLSRYTDYSVPALSFLPLVSGFLLVRRYSFSSVFGRCFSFLTSASSLWFLGEASWMFQSVILGEEMPFPSFSDFLWMSGYIFIGLGIYVMFKMFNPLSVMRRGRLILILSLTFAASMVTLALTPKIYSGATLIELFIYDWYLVMDIIYMGLLLVVFQTFMGGRISKAWLTLIIGIAVTLVADFFFNLATSVDSETYLLLGDLIYMNGYSLIALGFIQHGMEL